MPRRLAGRKREIMHEPLRQLCGWSSVPAQLSSGRTRYDHVLVDEGQDLHPAHWRLLRAQVGDGPDDMFIVADSQQRIYDRKVVLSRHGINVRGRSSVLRLNYRSTSEIVRWAVTLLGDEPTDDLDDGAADKRAYRSVLRGSAPVVTECLSTNAEIDQAVAEIRNLLEQGTQADEIVVATRLRESVDMVANQLNARGVQARVLGEIDGEVDKVHVATFHRLKGLEYRATTVGQARFCLCRSCRVRVVEQEVCSPGIRAFTAIGKLRAILVPAHWSGTRRTSFGRTSQDTFGC
jgi:DNA helicase IV